MPYVTLSRRLCVLFVVGDSLPPFDNKEFKATESNVPFLSGDPMLRELSKYF